MRPVVAKGKRVFAGGSGENLADPASGTDWLLRALDARSGALLWEDVVDAALGGDEVVDLVVRGKRLFAAGTTANGVTPQSRRDALVRAYTARGGSLLWEDRVDRGEAQDELLGLAVEGGRLYGVGHGGDVVDPIGGSGRDGTACGIGTMLETDAWVPNQGTARAASVVDVDCKHTFNFAHEIGRNLGAAHDEYEVLNGDNP